MKYDKYDLIIAGTGPASTFFLKKYLEKSSEKVKVLVLEKGFLYPHSERLKEKQGQQSAYSKTTPSSTSKTTGKGWAYTLGFGGSSNCWYGCTPRFMPSDFKLKSLYGIADDWPITYDELEPYYTETEQLMSISGPEITPFPKSKAYPLPPHSLSTVDIVLQEKYGKLYISQPTARASQTANGRNACCSSGVCGVCPMNAKFTVENSNFAVYEDARVELIFDATVTGFNLQNDTAKSVTFLKDGKESVVDAEVFALGTHAISNPNILLNSGDKNPMTGKCLGEQYGLQAVVFLEDMPNLGGSSWVSANGYMLYDGEHRKDYAACLIESSNSAEWIRIEDGKWRNLISLRMIFEDLPMPHNYVSTTPGDITKAQTFFKEVSAYTMKGVDNMKNNLNNILSCLPVEKIEFKKPFGTESHIIGTTRMSSDAKNGVVDKNLIHHQYRNLFVLGSGSFTTYSPANPTLTLSALSLHAADKSF